MLSSIRTSLSRSDGLDVAVVENGLKDFAGGFKGHLAKGSEYGG